ncbi:hypothetical protein [uncultured Winogradskyella sp.]|uniref:lipopolysaccharide biosynthesis protein n=1 Tax=uncultured Winogradskyella sp. TaxID=395353 RepID=UPI002627E93F|nr:hypothetical protein [uncultured Winogradskyella sp.]
MFKLFKLCTKRSLFKLFNLKLRVAPLSLKFLLFAILSKVFTPEVYGTYTLVTTTITISIFVLGLDFYNYSIREILLSKERKINKLFNTFILYFITYFIVAFVLSLILIGIEPSIGVSYNLFIIVAIICFSEHLSQEIYRLQIAYKKILTANLVFFSRSFFWMFYLVTKVMFFKEDIAMEFIFLLWMIFNLLSILSVIIIYSKSIFGSYKEYYINKYYLLKGLRISLLFFLGTLSLKSIEYLNRYVVDFFLGKELTGIFSFFSNIALIMSVYINTIVVSFELPSLIEKSEDENINNYFNRFKTSFFKQLLFICLVLIVVIYPILYWQNIDLYKDYIYVYFILIVASAILNYSLVYHFYLYIKKKDKLILSLTAKSGVVNLVFTLILTYVFGLLGTSIAFLITAICLYYLRKTSSQKNGYD